MYFSFCVIRSTRVGGLAPNIALHHIKKSRSLVNIPGAHKIYNRANLEPVLQVAFCSFFLLFWSQFEVALEELSSG